MLIIFLQLQCWRRILKVKEQWDDLEQLKSSLLEFMTTCKDKGLNIELAEKQLRINGKNDEFLTIELGMEEKSVSYNVDSLTSRQSSSPIKFELKLSFDYHHRHPHFAEELIRDFLNRINVEIPIDFPGLAIH